MTIYSHNPKVIKSKFGELTKKRTNAGVICSSFNVGYVTKGGTMIVDVIALLCIILALPHFVTTRNWLMVALCVILFIFLAINRRLKDSN